MVTEKEVRAVIEVGLCLFYMDEFGAARIVTPDLVTDDGKHIVDWCGFEYGLDEVYLTRASAELAEIRKQRDELAVEEAAAAEKARIAERKTRARMRGE